MASSVYTPRRFGARWRDATTPPEVLDIIRHPAGLHSWDVLLWSRELCPSDGTFANTWVSGLDIGAYGHLASFELKAYEASAHRYRFKNRRTRWADLPEPVRQAVLDWLEEDYTRESISGADQ